jgi:hypothetical protein
MAIVFLSFPLKRMRRLLLYGYVAIAREHLPGDIIGQIWPDWCDRSPVRRLKGELLVRQLLHTYVIFFSGSEQNSPDRCTASMQRRIMGVNSGDDKILTARTPSTSSQLSARIQNQRGNRRMHEPSISFSTSELMIRFNLSNCVLEDVWWATPNAIVR